MAPAPSRRAQRLDPRCPRGLAAAGARPRRHSAIPHRPPAMTLYPLKFVLGPLTLTAHGIMMMLALPMPGWATEVDLRAATLDDDYAADAPLAARVGGT